MRALTAMSCSAVPVTTTMRSLVDGNTSSELDTVPQARVAIFIDATAVPDVPIKEPAIPWGNKNFNAGRYGFGGYAKCW